NRVTSVAYERRFCRWLRLLKNSAERTRKPVVIDWCFCFDQRGASLRCRVCRLFYAIDVTLRLNGLFGRGGLRVGRFLRLSGCGWPRGRSLLRCNFHMTNRSTHGPDKQHLNLRVQHRSGDSQHPLAPSCARGRPPLALTYLLDLENRV